jgi:hypothetical protein
MKDIRISIIIIVFTLYIGYSCEEYNELTSEGLNNIPSNFIEKADYYVATWGNDANDGSYFRPWLTWHKAINSVNAGDTVYIRGGIYSGYAGNAYGAMLYPYSSGTVCKPICIFNYPGETPILDMSGIRATGTSVFGIKINYIKNWHIKGLHIMNLSQPNSGEYSIGFISFGCDSLLLENMVVHNIGGPGFVIGETCKNVVVLNCDSYNNYDNVTNGENANGFSIGGIGAYVNISLIGCRAWYNSDDGFDNFGSDGIVYYKSCWAFNNGYGSAGNGFGFKLGPDGDMTFHIYISSCIASINQSVGFGQNAQLRPITFYNNSTYKNRGAGFSFGWGTGVFIFRNNIAYGEPDNTFNTNAIHDHNSWDLPVTVSDSDFMSLDATVLSKDRKTDGSLPDIQFLKLSAGSDLIDKGIDVGLPFTGNAPDLGTFEK